jgi:hypothetical protein
MNKKFSEEIIEIDGKEYTLFMNRQGVVNWEKITKLKEKSQKYQEKYIELNEDFELTDDFDPFQEDKTLEDDVNEMHDIYSKFYWIALYTNHKFTISEANKLFEKAMEEYGFEQLADLAQQMLDNVNTNTNQNLKNLKALKPKK